jgi:hypothetical protein
LTVRRGGCVSVQSDVDEALRLMKMSKISLMEGEAQGTRQDPISAIYSLIRDDKQRREQETYTWAAITALLAGKDFSVCRKGPLPTDLCCCLCMSDKATGKPHM